MESADNRALASFISMSFLSALQVYMFPAIQQCFYGFFKTALGRKIAAFYLKSLK